MGRERGRCGVTSRNQVAKGQWREDRLRRQQSENKTMDRESHKGEPVTSNERKKIREQELDRFPIFHFRFPSFGFPITVFGFSLLGHSESKDITNE